MKATGFETALWGFSWEEANGDKAQQGIANLTDEDGVRLEIPFGSIEEEESSPIIVITDSLKKYEVLYGISRANDYLALRDVISNGTTWSFPGGNKETLRAAWLFSSKQPYDTFAPVTSIRLYLRGLRDWAQNEPIEKWMMHEEQKLLEYGIVYKRENAVSEKLIDNDKMTISLEHSLTVPARVSGIHTIKHDRFLQIDLREPRSFENANREIISPLVDFFSFCIGFIASIESIELKFEGTDCWVKCYGQLVYNDLSVLSEKQSSQIILSQKKLGEKIGDIIERWFAVDEDLKSTIQYLIPLMVHESSLPLELRFASAAMSLESLSRYNHKLTKMSEEEFASVLEYVDGSLEGFNRRQWVLDNLKGANRRNQRKLIGDLCDDLGAFASYFVDDKRRFIETHCELRNNQMHHNPKNPSLPTGEDLFYHTWAVLFLCYGGVLHYLGFSPDEIIDLIRESGYRRWAFDRARAMHASQNNAE